MSVVKEATICRHYRAELKRLRASVPCVTAGRLATAMGVSRATAKKYLDMNVRAGYLMEYEFIHVNGMAATAYTHVKAGA